MATFLDVTLIQTFNVIFPVLLVFAVVFALLQKTKVLGDKPGINVFIAIVLALMTLLIQDVIDIINTAAPWFVFTFLAVVFLLLLFQIVGATEKDIGDYIRKDKAIKWAIAGVGLAILGGAAASVLGQKIGPFLPAEDAANITDGSGIPTNVATSSFSQNITATLFHPKVLGIVILFAVAIAAVAFLSGDAGK